MTDGICIEGTTPTHTLKMIFNGRINSKGLCILYATRTGATGDRKGRQLSSQITYRNQLCNFKIGGDHYYAFTFRARLLSAGLKLKTNI